MNENVYTAQEIGEAVMG